MDLIATLAEIGALPIDERIHIVQAIWDGIAAEQAPFGLTDEQKTELDRRMAELDANPENVLTWEEVKAKVQNRA